jgi:hypothetical protein
MTAMALTRKREWEGDHRLTTLACIALLWGYRIMAMTRRNFIEAGIGGVAALSVAQGVSPAHSRDAGLGITVVGVDGADLTVPYLDDYLSVGATVWQYSQNTIDFDRFDSIDRFVCSLIEGHAGQVL